MPKAGLYIRVAPEDLKAWRAKALSCKLSLSEWIRQRCNGDTTLSAAPQDSPTFLLVGPEHPLSSATVVVDVLQSAKKYYTKPRIKKILGTDRKPCKHGMLFCKTCK